MNNNFNVSTGKADKIEILVKNDISESMLSELGIFISDNLENWDKISVKAGVV